MFGRQSLAQLQAEGMDTRHVKLTPGAASGVALIPVDKKGENTIIVASGANALLSAEDVREAESEIAAASFVLMQLETPVETLTFAAELAHKHHVKVVLNPAPFPKNALPDALLSIRTGSIRLISTTSTQQPTMFRLLMSTMARPITSGLLMLIHSMVLLLR